MIEPIRFPIMVNATDPVPTEWVDVWPTYDVGEAAQAVADFKLPYLDAEDES